jgi:hypothetical protein
MARSSSSRPDPANTAAAELAEVVLVANLNMKLEAPVSQLSLVLALYGVSRSQTIHILFPWSYRTIWRGIHTTERLRASGPVTVTWAPPCARNRKDTNIPARRHPSTIKSKRCPGRRSRKKPTEEEELDEILHEDEDGRPVRVLNRRQGSILSFFSIRISLSMKEKTSICVRSPSGRILHPRCVSACVPADVKCALHWPAGTHGCRGQTPPYKMLCRTDFNYANPLTRFPSSWSNGPSGWQKQRWYLVRSATTRRARPPTSLFGLTFIARVLTVSASKLAPGDVGPSERSDLVL